MQSTHPVIILPGQLYLDEEKNCYLIVSRRKGEMITYQGFGFVGMIDDETFIERFQPVDPADVEADELTALVALCPNGVQPVVGFIKD
jgi:hypothetical protein